MEGPTPLTPQFSIWVELITHAVSGDLGPSDSWPVADGYRDSLALATVDAIQSLGVRYAGVTNVIGRYRGFRAEQGADADLDGASSLRQSFEDLGGVEGWIRRIGNRQRVFARMDAPLKAAVIRDAADLLIGLGLEAAADVRNLCDVRRAELQRGWLGLKSQNSGISFRYLLMLVGEEGVKPDRMILRYLSARLPGQPALSMPDAVAILRQVAEEMNVSLTGLDHAIWQYQRLAPTSASPQAVAVDHRGTFEVYADADGTFRWHLKAHDGVTVATSALAYDNKEHAERGVELVQRAASGARIVGK